MFSGRRRTIHLRACFSVAVIAAGLFITAAAVHSRAADRSESAKEKTTSPSSADDPSGTIGQPPNPQQGDEPDEQPCEPWGGQNVYCDVVGGNVVLNGTSDDEKIHLEESWVQTGPGDEDYEYILTILVMHSDASSEWFEFSETDMLASAGIGPGDPLPPGFQAVIHLDAGCGNDVVVNDTAMDVIAYLGAGHDYYCGGDGKDFAFGQSGTDLMYGGQQQDELRGGPGSDILNGGIPADGVFVWPATFKMDAWKADPFGQVFDDFADLLDCGQDGDGDLIFAESFNHPVVGWLPYDSVVNLDWNSPIGTDVVRMNR